MSWYGQVLGTVNSHWVISYLSSDFLLRVFLIPANGNAILLGPFSASRRVQESGKGAV